MRLFGRTWRLALTVACMVGYGALARAEAIRDWPCAVPLAPRFEADAVWGAALAEPLPAGWRDDAEVREVVEVAANPENPPSRGEREIAAFAERLGADRQERLLRVFAGLLDEFDTLRGFVIEGVRDFVVRAKILDGAVAEHDSALAALPADGGAEVEEKRRGYIDARFWDARHRDDAMEEAEFLCHRYAYLDEKLGRLTAAVRSAF